LRTDGTAQRYRWLESGLHDLDFPILRQRPIWDFVVLPLLLLVTFACATGAWLSFMRIGRDFTAISQRFRKRN
jgi:ribose/xylose/arabinose/galactoside ABC-type transport system permease subunit